MAVDPIQRLVRELAQARKLARIVSVQNRYSLGDRAHDAVVDRCAKDGLAFLPWYPLHDRANSRRIDTIARTHKATTAQVALAWLLRRSPAMLPIPGTASIDHFDENWAARDLVLDDSEFAAL